MKQTILLDASKREDIQTAARLLQKGGALPKLQGAVVHQRGQRRALLGRHHAGGIAVHAPGQRNGRHRKGKGAVCGLRQRLGLCQQGGGGLAYLHGLHARGGVDAAHLLRVA